MICCHRTWRRQTARHSWTAFQDRRHGNAVGAAAAVRISFAKTFCAAAGGTELLPGELPHVTIPPELEAQILRYYHAEKWTVGTIAAQLRVHHTAVARVLSQAGLPRSGRPPRPSRIDPYLPFIRQTQETFPTLTASRLHAMVFERGYRGCRSHFRYLISCHHRANQMRQYGRACTTRDVRETA